MLLDSIPHNTVLLTAGDYAILTKKVYPNADAVVAYGGDSLNPPVYGKVFVAVKTATGATLNDQTKKNIAADLRKYAMASIDPVIIDPENLYIYTKVFVLYDTGSSSDTSTIKTNVQTAISQWAQQTQINNFNSTFRSQAYEKAITLSNNAITDVSLQVTLLRYIIPVVNQTNTYSISTGSALYNSAPSKTSLSVDGAKEPILLSGQFRTADRPGVDQQFEDDGYETLEHSITQVQEKYLQTPLQVLSTMTQEKLPLVLLLLLEQVQIFLPLV